MTNFTRILYGILTVITLFSFSNSNAQCSIASSDGYTVTMQVAPVSIIAPASCPNGFNYNVTLNYHVVFGGNNIPANLYTLQGNIYCGGQANFFSMPVSGGSGFVNSVSNPYRNTTNCAGATVSSLQCTNVEIIIQGPGINYQTFSCASGSILPINLVSFNGRLVNNNNVYLKWVTASETNNKSFTIERSSDARTWQPVKTLAGSGNSAATKQYDYTDEGLSIGMYYYRLKQTDISGTVSYSNIIGANVIKSDVVKDVTLSYDQSNQLHFAGLGNSSEWDLAVYNSASALLVTKASLQSPVVQLPGLAQGIYFARLRNKFTNTEKVLKFINR